MVSLELSETLDTIQRLAEEIVDVTAGLVGGSSSVAMKNASEICNLVDRIRPTSEMEVLYGEMGRRQSHDDGVSGSGKELCYVRHKADSREKSRQVAERLRAQKATKARLKASAQKRRRVRK